MGGMVVNGRPPGDVMMGAWRRDDVEWPMCGDADDADNAWCVLSGGTACAPDVCGGCDAPVWGVCSVC